MSILVDGILKSSAGNVIGNADIVLTAISTSLVVLGGTPLSIKTDPEGHYSFTLHNGNYAVSISKSGNNWFSGMITVTDLTVPKSINALLLQDAMMAEIPADYWSYFQSQTGILFTSFGKIDDAVTTTVDAKNVVLVAKDITVTARNEAEAFSNVAQSGSDAYVSVAEAQSAIDSGIEKRRFFPIIQHDDAWSERYENVRGIATPTGERLPNSNVVYSALEKTNSEVLERKSIINRVRGNSLAGMSELVTDDNGNISEFLKIDGTRHFSAMAIGATDDSPKISSTPNGAKMSGGEMDFYNVVMKNIAKPTSGQFARAIFIDRDENGNVRRVIYDDGREVSAGMASSTGDKEILPPQVFNKWEPDFKIFQRRDLTYYSDFNIDSRRPFDVATADHIIYVDANAPQGGNGSITSPFTSLASISGLTGKVFLRARSGVYKGSNSFVGANITASSLVIDCWGSGRVISSTENDAPMTWVKTSNYSNIYECQVDASTFGNVIDRSVHLPAISADPLMPPPTFDDGEHAVYRQVLTMLELDSTPGTCRLNAAKTMVYIHPFRSRLPDTDIVSYRNVINFDYSQPNAVLWMSDISFNGGTPTRVASGRGPTTTMKIYGKNIAYLYSGEGVSGGYVTNGSSMSYHVNSIVSANMRDGLGYHGIWPLVAVEIDCIGRRNGYDLAESNNGSTMHDGGVSLRLNSHYPENQNRNIHDINNSQNWLIGCIARDATGPINNRYDFIAGAGDVTDATVTILQDCVGIGSTYNIATWQGRLTSSVVYVLNTRTDGLVYPNSNIVSL